MTDNEIIKALEWCEQFENNIVMSNRSGEKFILALQAMQIIKQALKEYTRQKAEIKSLTEKLEALGDPLQDAHYKIAEQQAEIERLQKIIVGFIDEVGTWSNKYDVDISTIHKLPLLAKEDFNIRNKIKSEAIKEFAEKLKDYHKNYEGFCVVDDDDIDNLVAEMTENDFKE